MSLQRHEWPGDVLDKMTPSIFRTAVIFREATGCRMTPSPDPEAHVRWIDGASRHAIGADGMSRLSDATDLFLLDNKDAATAWRLGQRVAGIGGFGIYFDTVLNGEKRVLFHIDSRPDRLMWICPSRDRTVEKRSYIYYRDDNPGPYLDLLSAELARV